MGMGQCLGQPGQPRPPATAPWTPDTPHALEVRAAVAELAASHHWAVDPAVEEALCRTDLPAYRRILDNDRVAEPCWDPVLHGKFSDDSRVRHLAAGGYVFENLSVYAVLTQLLYPAIAGAARAGLAPRVLDIGCGTGFLTTVLARLAAPAGGSVTAVDIFARQVDHTRTTLSQCCPELLPRVSFAVANGWEFEDSSGVPFHAIAVAAQAAEIPQGLVRQLAPMGRLVLPLGPQVAIDRKDRPDRFQQYWMVEKDAEGAIAFSGRVGPIGVNFLPLLPPG